MMRFNRIDDFLRLLVLTCKVCTDLNVRAFDFMVDGFADVMQETGALCKRHITAELCCHDPREMRDFYGMIEHALPVTCTVAHTAKNFDKFRMDAVHPCIKDCLLARFLDAHIDFMLRLFDHLFDTCWMDAPILDELFKRDARDFAAHGVEPREQHSFRRIVDDEINAG